VNLPDINNQQGRNMTKHVGFVYAYVKKAKYRKSNGEGGDKQKKQDS